MTLLASLNHVAVITSDLDRFVDFYTRVFGMEEVFRENIPGLRHAILRIADGSSWLHPAELQGNAHAVAIPQMFQRGHLDHIALLANSPESFERLRERLMEVGASDGTVEDLGAFLALWFQDPDGMRGEVTLLVNPSLEGIHAPRRMARPPTSATPPG